MQLHIHIDNNNNNNLTINMQLSLHTTVTRHDASVTQQEDRLLRLRQRLANIRSGGDDNGDDDRDGDKNDENVERKLPSRGPLHGSSKAKLSSSTMPAATPRSNHHARAALTFLSPASSLGGIGGTRARAHGHAHATPGGASVASPSLWNVDSLTKAFASQLATKHSERRRRLSKLQASASQQKHNNNNNSTLSDGGLVPPSATPSRTMSVRSASALVTFISFVFSFVLLLRW
jgi:hypothetical protein